MSGIYIPGVKKPTACMYCPVVIDGGVDFSFCPFGHKRVENPMAVMPDCSLVPVPDHGRLIDAERLKEVFHRNVAGGEAFDQLIDIAPTIIPADPAEEGKG